MKSIIAFFVLLVGGVLTTTLAYAVRDLETGVFLSRDPAGFVDGPNVYTYVKQNPWSKFDAEGLLETTITTEQAKKVSQANEKINKIFQDKIDAAFNQGGTPEQITENAMKSLTANNWNGNLVEVSQKVRSLGDKYVVEGELNGSKYEGMDKLFPAGFNIARKSGLPEVAPGVNISGHAIGLDKLDHFTLDGYSTYDATELRGMTKDSARAEWAILENTVYGKLIDGVHSNADIEANMSGGQFYKDLRAAASKNEQFTFDIGKYASEKWDENKNLNEYTPEVEKLVNDNENKKK